MFDQELEAEGLHRQAEHHFVEGGDWKAAVNMYRAKSMWDDAYRVSLSCGLVIQQLVVNSPL